MRFEVDLHAAYAKKQGAADGLARDYQEQLSELDSIFRRLAEVLSQPENRQILWRLAEESPKSGEHPQLTQFNVPGTQICLELYTQGHRFYRIVQYVGQCSGKNQPRYSLDVYCSGTWGIHEAGSRGRLYILTNSDASQFTPNFLGPLPSSNFRDLVGFIEAALLNLADALGIDYKVFIP